MNKRKINVKKGKKYRLKITILPKDTSYKKVLWKISNKEIASISKKGVITAKKRGRCIIYATSKKGNKKVACRLTVK